LSTSATEEDVAHWRLEAERGTSRKKLLTEPERGLLDDKEEFRLFVGAADDVKVDVSCLMFMGKEREEEEGEEEEERGVSETRVISLMPLHS